MWGCFNISKLKICVKTEAAMWHTKGHGQNFYNKFVTDGIQGNKNTERVIDEEAEENETLPSVFAWRVLLHIDTYV